MSARTIHPFPARMAPEIATDAIPERARSALTVLDPMCGSGTVLATAVQRGHHAIGVDIDPLAVMMSKLAVMPVATDNLVVLASTAVAKAEKAAGVKPWGEDAETEAFVDYWFAARQKRHLIALMTALRTVEDASQHLALQLAVSRIIVTKSPQASLAADTAHSRPHRVMTESNYDVFGGFARSAQQLARMLAERKIVGTGQVGAGDARVLEGVGDCSVDLAVTSPPYLNALDYLRGHKLALVWFGHTVADLREKRGASIGTERGLDREGSSIVTEIIDVIENEAVDEKLLRRPMLERFADDCVRFAKQLHRTVKPDGKVVLVVGNSTLRGNYIRNDVIAQKAMEYCGFRTVEHKEREIPPSSRYMAIDAKKENSSISKRMRKEVVLTMVR